MAARQKREADPPTQVAGLVRSLAGGGLARGYVLRGDERYFREQAIELVRAKAVEGGLEVCAHDGKDPEFRLGACLEDLTGRGLFAAERLVLVRNADVLMKKAGKEQPPFTRAVLAFCEHGELGGAVVLSAGSLRADNVAVKALVKAGGVVLSCRKLWDSPPPWSPDPRQVELVRWIVNRAQALGLRLDANEAVYLAAATGNDLFALDTQLVKLRHVPAAERRRAVGWESGGSPFQLAEHIGRGDLPRAMHGIEALFRAGFQERDGSRLLDPAGLVQILLAALTRIVRQSLAGAEAVAHGRDPASAIEGGHPRARQELAERVRLRSRADWRAMLDELAQLERRSKTGGLVDASDFAVFAARWGRRSAAPTMRA